MITHRISETAAATGFSADTLRYYERIGLLVPSERSGAGYRLYHDADLDTLAFIAHAKTAGLSLDEIAELMELRAAGDCEPVRDRLHELVCGRADAARDQAGELAGFAARLDALASRLAGTDPPARCGPDCGCTSAMPAVEPPDGPLTRACTLPDEERPGRLAAFRTLLAGGEVIEATEDFSRVRLAADPATASRAAELAMLEQACCHGMIRFSIHCSADAIIFDTEGPQAGELVSLTGLAPA